MGKDAAEIRMEFHSRLGQMARELTNELYPDGLPRGTKFSDLETVAGALGDEIARQLIEINVQEQADDWPEDELGECLICGGGGPQGPCHATQCIARNCDTKFRAFGAPGILPPGLLASRTGSRLQCRATDLSLRLAVDRMVRLGAGASEIARQLDLPLSTVRGLIRRALQAETDHSPAALQPRYHACGPRPLAAPPVLETTVELRRHHPRWGAGRIRVELMRMDLGYELPSVRTIQRWLRLRDLAPAPAGRPRRNCWQRAEHPRDTWQVDAADQKRLASGAMVPWLQVVDECSGAALRSHVFFPGVLYPGAFGTGARRVALMF